MTAPTVTVVMPVYNTAKYVQAAVDSVLKQTFPFFELLIIDDAGTDGSIGICRQYTDPRIRIISQENRGLAGARNTGIRQARGEFIALLDSDDIWEPEKLIRHVEHLRRRPNVGVSYAASRMMDDDGRLLRITQKPKLVDVRPQDVFMRNPVGNGSAPVIRKGVFEDIAIYNSKREEFDYFDESFRQSEDIECWCRIALTTSWRFEGIKGAYTRYRINENGLSANVIKQFESWSRVRDIVKKLNPGFARIWAPRAEAYQLRYLARRCVREGDGAMAVNILKEAVRTCPNILWEEPFKSLSTVIAATIMRFMPPNLSSTLQSAIVKLT